MSKRETSTRSPNKDGENYIGEEDEEEIDEGKVDGEGEIEDEGVTEGDGDENDADDRTPEVGSSGNPGSGHTHPFILPQMWIVNDFLPKMTTNIFKNLRDRFQIPNHIPIRFPGNFEKCYSGETADVGMYDATLAGLRLPLMALHRQLANFLGLSVNQITPNAWRIFIGVEILWGHLSGGNRQLTLDEFFWCYQPQHIVSSQGIYHFAARKKVLRLVSDMLNSNRNWKSKYFFVKGTDWVCRPEEWDTMPYDFDNTWGIIKDSGLMPSSFF